MTPHPLLLALRLEGRRVVVFGSGDELDRRVAMLLECGARVRVVSTAPGPGVLPHVARGAVELYQRGPLDQDLDDVWLAVLADRDADLAVLLAGACERRRVPFCAVDQPGFGSFSHVAVARSGALSIAVSTDGEAPALARRLREELERLLTESKLEKFVERLAALRRTTAPDFRREVMNAAVAALRIDGKIEVPKR